MTFWVDILNIAAILSSYIRVVAIHITCVVMTSIYIRVVVIILLVLS